MDSSKNNPVESSELKEPYIGMPIYVNVDENDFDYMDNEMVEADALAAQNEVEIAQQSEDFSDYCRDTDFERWPLAMAYVPWQNFSRTYDLDIAFEVGTIFPDLNLPFLGGGVG